MARLINAQINLDAIKHNYLYAKACSKNGKAIAVIKANAYGHGAVKVAQSLKDIADAFGVACIEEAMELRAAGIHNPILLLEGFFTADELQLIEQYNLWCVLHSQQQVAMLNKYKTVKPIQVWLKMDSGMHRLGFSPAAYPLIWRVLTEMPQVSEIVHMSHFASADSTDTEFTEQQIYTFFKTIENLPGEVSIANSAATLSRQFERLNWARPGIMLYGSSPIEHVESAEHLQPAMRLTARIIAERVVKANEGVGYNHLWVADKETKIGTVAVGYADGYPRQAVNGTPVYINGKISQVLGRVSMDMMTVDLSMFDETCIGYEVELWGNNVSANQVAKHAGTISYTLFCGLTRRVTFTYI